MNKPIRVLIVEDSEDDAALMLRELRRGGYDPSSERVQTAAGLRAALAVPGWDIILSDYSMPQFTGIQALEVLKATGMDIPFILISGTVGEDVAVAAMKAGALDYFLKSNLARLPAAIERELREAEVRRGRKRAENELLQSEERFRLIAENVADLIVVLDLEGRRLYNSPSYKELIGEPDAMRGTLSFNEIHPDDREKIKQVFRETVRTGRGQRAEFRFLLPDGSVRFIESQGSTIRDEAGKVIRVLVVSRDVTERKRAEEALRESEEKFRGIFQGAAEGILVSNFETQKFVYANPAVCRMLGYTEKELVHMGLSDLHPHQDLETVVAAFMAQARGEKTLAPAIPCLCKDGTTIYAEINASRLDVDGKDCCVAFLTDVTERKRAEKVRNAIYRISEAANSPQSLEEFLRSTHEVINELMPAKNFYIALYDSAVGVLRFSYYVDERDPAPPSTVPLARGFTEYVLRTGKPLLATAEVLEDLARRGEIELWGTPPRERIGVPLRAGNKTVGALVVQTYTEGVSYGEQEKNALMFVSEQVGMAIARKQSEQHLAQMEGRYRGLLEAAPDAMVVVNPGGEIVLLNLQAEKQFGYRRDELVGKNVKSIIPEGFAERLIADALRSAEDALAQQIGTGIELTGRRKNGSDFPIEIMLSPLESAEGILVTAAIRDITERKRTEEEVRKLSRTVEQSPISVVITNLQGNIEYVNPKFTEITGYTLEEVRGQNPRILKSGETPPEEYRKLWEAITTGAEWRGELHNRRKDGTLFWERASISPIRDASGTITHFLGVKEDITAHKLLEEQFVQAQKMEAVGRLAGGVAHDFNNLLTVINGYCYLLLERLDAESLYCGPIAEIQKAGERAALLTRQLLTFSRRQIVAPRVIDLNATVSGIEQMLRRLIGEDVDLATVLHPSLGKVKADPGQIEQVLTNLVVNSRDAMPQGGRLTIETANVELDEAYTRTHYGARPGRFVMLAVSDSGHGMDTETQSHVFEPFFTTKEAGKGTGLGLATVYGIVKQGGGYIMVYSEPGEGTVVKIYLPRVEEAGAVEEEPQPSGPAPGGNETILVTEDQDAVRVLVCEVLKSKGYKVLEASRGEEALPMAREYPGPIHLLVTDVVMPGMSGRELARNLASLHPEIEVLYMSGYTGNAIVHHGVLEGGLAFIQKPFTPEALARKVREVLDTPPKAGDSGRGSIGSQQ